MRTLRALDDAAVAEATSVLDERRLVVLPTDTQYGLAADALDEDAVLDVFRAKERAADQALPVCISAFSDIGHVATATPLARRLADAFWPGAVTLVLPAKPWLPDALTAGGATIAVRCPDQPFALALARRFGPFTITSANTSGAPPPADIKAAQAMLGERVALYVDGGTLAGAPSTLVDCTGNEPKIIRAGAVPPVEVERIGRQDHRELQEGR